MPIAPRRADRRSSCSRIRRARACASRSSIAGRESLKRRATPRGADSDWSSPGDSPPPAEAMSSRRAGPDDFVVKPFSTPELLARIRAQLRRIGARPQLEFPDLTIDVERRRVVQGTREVRLTPTEFAILELLTR